MAALTLGSPADPASSLTIMDNKQLIAENKVLDVREMPCSVKHGLILSTWFRLPVGDYFILVNTHDPVPLRHQFQAEFGDSVSWEYLDEGADEFWIKISKLAEVRAVELESPCRKG
jgi:uncharacterized protein (DUF2249 family)